MREKNVWADDKYIYWEPDIYPSSQGKEIGGRWQARGYWRFEKLAFVLERLKASVPASQLRFSPECRKMIETEDAGSWKHPFGPWVDDSIDQKLFTHQREGIAWLAGRTIKRSLLAFSPRLGKSATAILAAESLGLKRILIVCPKSLRMTWQDEIWRWLGPDEDVDIRFQEGPSTSRWQITNYDTLRRHSEKFEVARWDAVVFDESLLLKNKSSQRHSAAAFVSRNVEYVWLLSGSPTSRYADDLYGQFYLLNSSAFASYWRFARTYCHVDDTAWGSQIVGTRATIDLQHEFRDLMLVRDQLQTMPDLPEMIFSTVVLGMSLRQNAMYQRAYTEFILELETGEEMTIAHKASRFLRLQQIVSGTASVDPSAKTHESSKVEWVVETLDTLPKSELPMVIWVHWRENAEYLYQQIREHHPDLAVELILGGNPDTEQIVKDYQGGQLDVLILSLTVGKYGLNLINTQTVVYFDRVVDADAMHQSLYRFRGPGLSHHPHVITLKVAYSVESLVDRLLEGKLTSISHVSNSDLKTLLGVVQNERHYSPTVQEG